MHPFPGSVQMPQLALQQVCPAAQVFLPQVRAAPAAGAASGLHSGTGSHGALTHWTCTISQWVPAMQRTLAQLILLSSTGPAPLTAPLAGGGSPGAGEAPPWVPGTGPGESASQICCVHMPSGGVQMLQLALQQISPAAQLSLPHAGP